MQGLFEYDRDNVNERMAIMKLPKIKLSQLKLPKLKRPKLSFNLKFNFNINRTLLASLSIASIYLLYLIGVLFTGFHGYASINTLFLVISFVQVALYVFSIYFVVISFNNERRKFAIFSFFLVFYPIFIFLVSNFA